jgi:NADH-quinone oxidoreductase subunit L
MTMETLVWLTPLPPLLAFVCIVLFTNKNKALSHWIAIVMMALAWAMSWGVLFYTIRLPSLGWQPIHGDIDWLPFGGPSVAGTAPMQMGILVDQLSAVMLFFVPLICLLIFIYSVGYGNFGKPEDLRDQPGKPPHHGIEPLYSRFFAFLSLFAFAMLLLIVADNLLLMFAGWELMGLCSYLLIGFWYARVYPDPKQINPRQAAVKAFLVTRVGDVFMLLGIAYLFAQTGTLSFDEILYAHQGQLLAMLSTAPSFVIGLSAANLISLLLFAGAIGKSAQFPLHVWLPDAMEGPTPVSAMIHAATMVSAGVYAMLRIYPLLSAGWQPGNPLTPPMLVMAILGSFTALFAATIAIAQNDIKKVLAYSTISQLGFMIAALGIGAYVAAAFHLMTHAFFKALLFLGSGSVIHGMEHGEQQAQVSSTSSTPIDPQNMLNMGGLRDRMPLTFWTFLIGGLALAGYPFATAGFWSKDEIFAEAWVHTPAVYVTLAITAVLTAFYIMRLVSMTFFAKPRTLAAQHASENKWTMTLPLAILAFFAIAAGWINIPNDFLGLHLGGLNWFQTFVSGTLVVPPEPVPFNFVPLTTSLVVVLAGIMLGGWVYHPKPITDKDPLAKILGPIYSLWKNKYFIDEGYDLLFVRPVRWLGETAVSIWIDRRLIDGGLHWIGLCSLRLGESLHARIETPLITGLGNLTGKTVQQTGQSARSIQTGKVQDYLLIALAVLVVTGLVLFWPMFVGP